MTDPLLIEEFRVSFFVSRRLPDARVRRVRSRLGEHRFRAALRRAVRSVCRERGLLKHLIVEVSW